jgi:hypothetical protein
MHMYAGHEVFAQLASRLPRQPQVEQLRGHQQVGAAGRRLWAARTEAKRRVW